LDKKNNRLELQLHELFGRGHYCRLGAVITFEPLHGKLDSLFGSREHNSLKLIIYRFIVFIHAEWIPLILGPTFLQGYVLQLGCISLASLAII
jgi:hypothetical protein